MVMIGPRSFKRNFDANNYSTITYWEKKSGGDKLIVKIASQPAQSFGGWKRIKVLKFPSTYHERTLKSSQTLKHNSKSSTAPKSQFHIRRTRIEQKHRIARIWTFSLNNKWLENVGQQLACPKVVHARKAKATFMLPMGYVDWIGKYMNMKGRAKTVFSF